MLSKKKDDCFEGGTRASVPCWKGCGRGEKPACHLFAGPGGKVVDVDVPLECDWLCVWRGEMKSHCARTGVAQDAPPTPRDDRVWAGRLLGQPASVLPTRA
jgi:hypothetical protein